MVLVDEVCSNVVLDGEPNTDSGAVPYDETSSTSTSEDNTTTGAVPAPSTDQVAVQPPAPSDPPTGPALAPPECTEIWEDHWVSVTCSNFGCACPANTCEGAADEWSCTATIPATLPFFDMDEWRIDEVESLECNPGESTADDPSRENTID